MTRSNRTGFPWATAGLAAIGILLILYQTRLGPGTGGDSTSYLMGAENLLSGNGYARFSGGYELRPITGFPPLYSTLITAAASTGIETLQAARLLNALLFGANILLLGLLIRDYTQSQSASFAGGALFLVADTQFELHSWVMSEPLYIFLTLAGIYCLARRLGGGPAPWLLAAGAAGGLASLVRFVGPALTVTGFAAVLAFGARRRAADSIIYGALGFTPLLFWLNRNSSLAGTLVNRELVYHPIEPGLIRLFLAEVSSWFVPHEIPLPTALRAIIAVAIAFGVVGGALVLLGRAWLRRSDSRLVMDVPGAGRLQTLPWILAGYVTSSLVILLINSIFLDASTTSTAPPRYLAPVFAALMPLAISAVWTATDQSLRAAQLHRIGLIYVSVLVVLYALGTLSMLKDPIPFLGYTGRRVAWVQVVAALNQVPADSPIVSNNPELVYILAGRPAYVRPISYDQYQQAPRPDYALQLAAAEDQLGRGGVLVVFDQVEQDDLALIDGLGLEQYLDLPQARFYRLPAHTS